MLILPEELREKLKEPIGKLLDGKNFIKLISKEKYIVSIGDIVTYTLLENNILPIFCIVDFHTRRGKCSEIIIKKIKSFGNKSIVIENKAGTISKKLIESIKNEYKKPKIGNLRIEIKGEEDLASLPAIYYAPSDVTIIYGLPDKGVLVVKPTNIIKDKIKEIFDKM